MRILLVEDHQPSALGLKKYLEKQGHRVEIAYNGSQALKALQSENFDLMLLDLNLPDMSGIQVMSERPYPVPVVVMTAYGSIASAVEVMKEGAIDYLPKPINLDQLMHVIDRIEKRIKLEKENVELKTRLRLLEPVPIIIGESPSIKKIKELIKQVAPTDAAVLIQGESGTGKELVARAIHSLSKRARGPFVPVNCAAIPESLMESELFGYEKGAFTGASSPRPGKIEMAEGGTLFLDEIGDMPYPLQAKLLRTLESGEIQRLGSNKIKHVDFRLISATNRELELLVREGKFREDLFYRIDVVRIEIPPLRERREDIPRLVEHFIKEFSEKHHKTVKAVSPEVMRVFLEYRWPGNVRELRNVVEQMIVTAQGPELTLELLPQRLKKREEGDKIVLPVGISMREAEREIIKRTLEHFNGNRTRTAKALGIGLRTLQRKIKEYNLIQ